MVYNVLPICHHWFWLTNVCVAAHSFISLQNWSFTSKFHNMSRVTQYICIYTIMYQYCTFTCCSWALLDGRFFSSFMYWIKTPDYLWLHLQVYLFVILLFCFRFLYFFVWFYCLEDLFSFWYVKTQWLY